MAVATHPAITYAFNKCFADLLLFVRDNSPELKSVIRKHYNVMDSLSTDTSHVQFFLQNAHVDTLLKLGDDLETKDLDFVSKNIVAQPIRDISIVDLTRHLDAPVAWVALARIYTLGAIARVWCVATSPDGSAPAQASSDGLLRCVLEYARHVMTSSSEDEQKDAPAIPEDETAAALLRISSVCTRRGPTDQTPVEVPTGDDASVAAALAKLENSSFGAMAREITESLDLSSLDVSDPSELLNFNNLSDKSSVLGTIVSKVGSTIQTKLASGELDQQQLLREAVSLLSSIDPSNALGNNPLFDALRSTVTAPATPRKHGSTPRHSKVL